MRLNIISSIANVITRFSVNTADMLRNGNDSAAMYWQLQTCTAGSLQGRSSRAGLLLGNVSTGIGKHEFTEPAQPYAQDQELSHLFQRLS